MKRLILTLGFLLALVGHAAEKPMPPNIVFILADDLGWFDLNCYGRKEHHTPALDQLAREGMRFTSAYVAQPICSPSRAAIMTGKSPARLHLTTYLPGRNDAVSQKLLQPKIKQQLPAEEKTLAEYLSEAGYATACIGKWHLGGKGSLPTDQGFQVYHPGTMNTKPSETEGGKGEYDLTSKAIEFIEANKTRPFFLYLPHNNPHIAYSAKTNLIEKNQGAFEPVYAAMIETLDHSVSLLLKKIDEAGLRERTIFVFTSDNGGLHMPEGGHSRITHNGPLRAGKGYLYEGGLRVPLIVRWPGKITANTVADTPVINTDWLPTFVSVAGAAVGSHLDGQSILPILLGRETAIDRKFYWHFPHYTNQGGQPAGAIRQGDWKLIEHYEDHRVELYNLANDLAEKQNLASSEKARAAAMQNELAQWRKNMNAQTNTLNPNFNATRHAQLYVDFVPSKFEPQNANVVDWQRVNSWRHGMDAVLREGSSR